MRPAGLVDKNGVDKDTPGLSEERLDTGIRTGETILLGVKQIHVSSWGSGIQVYLVTIRPASPNQANQVCLPRCLVSFLHNNYSSHIHPQ